MTGTKPTEEEKSEPKRSALDHLLRGLIIGTPLGLVLFLIYIALAALGW